MRKNIVIGVIAKKMNNEKDPTMAKSFNVEQTIYNYVKNDNTSIIGLCAHEDEFINKNVLDICDGFIFQGGDYDICDYHKKVFEYAKEYKKPVLGICLGMQFMAMYSMNTNKMGKVVDVTNNSHHFKDKYHNVNIKEGTILHKLYGDKIEVNSRHNDCIFEVSSDFIISAISDDNIIEGIELKDKNNFMVGVQWHPESDDMKNKNMEKLINEFFNYIN